MKIYCFGFRYYPRTKIIEQAKSQGWLDQESVDNLEEGINAEAFIRGGDNLNKEVKKLQTFFTFLLYWPEWLNDFIINRKIYRFFLPLPYFITVIFSNWLRIPYRYNWALHITVVRYRHFMCKKTKQWFSSNETSDVSEDRGREDPAGNYGAVQ